MHWKKIVFTLVPSPLLVRALAWKEYLFGDYELKLLRKFTNPQEISIDVGSNKGVYSYHLGRLSKKIEAFEPNPLLADFVSRSKIRNLTVHPIGISDFIGRGDLEVPKFGNTEYNELAKVGSGNFSGDTKKFSIEISTLDTYFSNKKEKIGFIKIDVEGHEINVIRGASEVIKQNSPVLLVEIESRHQVSEIDEIFSEIMAHGYLGYFVEKGSLVPIESFNQEEMQRTYGRKIIQPYVNNFFFIPSVVD